MKRKALKPRKPPSPRGGLIPLLLLGASGSLFAGALYEHEIPPLSFPSTRNYGMGGPHTAYTDDVNSLFINPGALATAAQVSLTELSLGVHGDVLGLAEVLGTDEEALPGEILSWIEKTKGNIPMGLDLRGPLALARVGPGLSWGVFDRVYMDVALGHSTISVGAYGDLMVNLGYAYRVLDRGPHTVDVGGVGKGFGRFSLDTGKIKLTDILLGVITEGGGSLDAVTDRLSNTYLTIGGGLDLGAQYRFLGNLTAALVVADLFSLGYATPMDLGLGGEAAASDPYLGYISPKITLGVSYKVFENGLVTWAVMADYRDLVNLFKQNDYQSVNGFLNFSFGTEVTLLSLVSFRAGLNQMLPALGLGLDAKVLKLETAIYGKELGNEPGAFSTYALDIGILARF